MRSDDAMVASWNPAVWATRRSLGEAPWFPQEASAECRSDLLRPVPEEAALVVEVHAHPELRGTGVDRGLELPDTVRGRPCDGEAVGQVVEQPQLLDQAAVAAARRHVIRERVACAQLAHAREQLRRDVLALRREPAQVIAGGGQRHRDLRDGLAAA